MDLCFNSERGLCLCWCLLCRSLRSSILSSLCCLSLSLYCNGSSLLVCNLLSNSLVNLLLSLEVLSSSSLLLVGYLLLNSLCSCNLSLLPSIKLLLACSLVECALLNTTTEVLHHVNALTLKDVTSSVCWLSTCLNPIKSTIKIQIYCGWIGVRVISTNLLSKLTITWCTSVSDYDAVESIALAAMTLQTNTSCHCVVIFLWGHVPCC